MSGLKFEKGTCFFNKAAGPGGCINPCPDILPANFRIWELFEETWESGNFRGMDGDPVGRHFCCVESAARALEIPWNRKTFRRFKIILTVWLESVCAQIKEREAKRKSGKK